MIEQVSTALTFLAFFTEDGVGKTGLTVTVDVWGHSDTEIVTAASATEIGDGLYKYVLSGALTANGGAYKAVFKTADPDVDQKHLPALMLVGVAGVDNLNATVSSRASQASVDAVQADTDNLQTRLPVALVGGRIDAHVGAVADAVLTAAKFAAGAFDAVWSVAVRILTAATNITSQIADAVLDATAVDHNDAGTIGQKINAAGGASDPLLNPVPGDYAAGTAGYSLGRIGSAEVTVVSPVSADGETITLVQGDDYTGTRALVFASDDWPVLTALPVVFTARPVGRVIEITKAATVLTPSSCSVELDGDDTAALRLTAYEWSLKVTLSPGEIVTLAQGAMTVLDNGAP